MRAAKAGFLIEGLESRQLRSVTPTLAEGVLTLAGTDQKDAVVLTVNAEGMLDVKSGRDLFSYSVADLTKIVVNAGAGNDKITVRENEGPLLVDMVVDGGEGNDAIQTGSGNDIIDGGAGNDKCDGGAGDDVIFGGEGNDKLSGGDDNDQIDAGDGKDKIAGDGGDDNLDGGDGKDVVKAGDGADRLANDAANSREVKLRGVDDITHYDVTAVENLPEQVTELLAGIEVELPGFQVFRAETEPDAGYYSIYYRFGEDPQVYKLVVSVLDDELELVTRQVSPTEARASARAAFDSDQPNIGLVSLFQHPHNVWDVRYRDADGTVQSVTTTDIIWGIDDVESDQDDDGRRDPVQGGDGGGN